MIYKKRKAHFTRYILMQIFGIAVVIFSNGVAYAAEFKYSGDNGPGFWHETPGWELCAGDGLNARQSPIDIKKPKNNKDLMPLSVLALETEISLINNGHTIEQEYHNGSQMVLDGELYELLQFHFHSLTEHAVDGKRGELELHAVFRNAGTGNLAVIGQIFEVGKTNDFIQNLIDAGLPQKSGDVVHSATLINLTDVLTDTAAYYTYPGSLTTPGCNEIVTWFVLKEPTTASEEQISAFTDIMGNNFRPLQDLNGRTVFSTDEDNDDDDDNDN